MATTNSISKYVTNLNGDLKRLEAIIATTYALAESSDTVKSLMEEARTLLELGLQNEVDCLTEFGTFS